MIDILNINHGFREISLEFNDETKSYKIIDNGITYNNIVDYAKTYDMDEIVNLKEINNIFDLVQMVGLILSFREELNKIKYKGKYIKEVVIDFNTSDSKLLTTEDGMWFNITYNKDEDAVDINYAINANVFEDIRVTKIEDKKYKIEFIFNKKVIFKGIDDE